MFDLLRSPKGSLSAKAATICAIGMAIGYGTCGLVLATKGGDGGIWSDIETAGGIIFLLSLSGLIITAIATAIANLIERRRR